MPRVQKTSTEANTITRSRVQELKMKYGMKDCSDSEFIEWHRRNNATGYLIQIIES